MRRVSVAAAVLVLTLVAVAAASRTSDEPPIPTLGSLERAAGPADRLAGRSRELANLMTNADQARYVGTLDGRRVFIGPAPGHNVCLFEIGGGGVGGGCGPGNVRVRLEGDRVPALESTAVLAG